MSEIFSESGARRYIYGNYFDIQLRQILPYWAAGIVIGSVISVFGKEKKEQGLIKHIGFSFHSTPEELEKILSEHPEMEFVQLQINNTT